MKFLKDDLTEVAISILDQVTGSQAWSQEENKKEQCLASSILQAKVTLKIANFSLQEFE